MAAPVTVSCRPEGSDGNVSGLRFDIRSRYISNQHRTSCCADELCLSLCQALLWRDGAGDAAQRVSFRSVVDL